MLNNSLPTTHHQAWVDQLIDNLYDKMLDDYRINRFFNGKPAAEQSPTLKAFIKASLDGKQEAERLELLDRYFTAAFARNNAKPSLVTGNDFAFLLDIVGGQEIRTITALCEAHSFLLKLAPDDSHVDVVLELLQQTLTEMDIGDEARARLLALAEGARDGLLGRQIH